MCQVKNYTYLTGLVLIWGETTRFEIAAAAVHVCVCVCAHLMYYWNVLTVLRPLRGTRAGRQKRLLVLETIFSYPTRAGEELLHKNTSIRERASQRGGGGGGREEMGGRTSSMNGRERDSELFPSLPPTSPLCVFVCPSISLSHLVPDPVSARAVQIGCSCGEGSYGPLTGLLFPPVTHTCILARTYTRSGNDHSLSLSYLLSVHLLYLTISNLAGKTVVLSFHFNGFFCGRKRTQNVWNQWKCKCLWTAALCLLLWWWVKHFHTN